MSERKKIRAIISELTRLAASIQSYAGRMDDTPDYSLENYDTRTLLTELETAADILQIIQKELSYLSRPILETSRLWRNGSGLYETTSGHCFHAGSPIEILVPDQYQEGRSFWKRTHLKYDGREYYLAGHTELELKGLSVRVRAGDGA